MPNRVFDDLLTNSIDETIREIKNILSPNGEVLSRQDSLTHKEIILDSLSPTFSLEMMRHFLSHLSPTNIELISKNTENDLGTVLRNCVAHHKRKYWDSEEGHTLPTVLIVKEGDEPSERHYTLLLMTPPKNKFKVVHLYIYDFYRTAECFESKTHHLIDDLPKQKIHWHLLVSQGKNLQNSSMCCFSMALTTGILMSKSRRWQTLPIKGKFFEVDVNEGDLSIKGNIRGSAAHLIRCIAETSRYSNLDNPSKFWERRQKKVGSSNMTALNDMVQYIGGVKIDLKKTIPFTKYILGRNTRSLFTKLVSGYQQYSDQHPWAKFIYWQPESINSLLRDNKGHPNELKEWKYQLTKCKQVRDTLFSLGIDFSIMIRDLAFTANKMLKKSVITDGVAKRLMITLLNIVQNIGKKRTIGNPKRLTLLCHYIVSTTEDRVSGLMKIEKWMSHSALANMPLDKAFMAIHRLSNWRKEIKQAVEPQAEEQQLRIIANEDIGYDHIDDMLGNVDSETGQASISMFKPSCMSSPNGVEEIGSIDQHDNGDAFEDDADSFAINLFNGQGDY